MKRILLRLVERAFAAIWSRIEARYGPLYVTSDYRDEC